MTNTEFQDMYNIALEMFGGKLQFRMFVNGTEVVECGCVEKLTDKTVVIRTMEGGVKFYAISALVSIEPMGSGDADIGMAVSSAQPAVAQPTVEQSAVVQPAVAQPTVEQSAAVQPAVAQPTVEQPVAAQPAVAQPTVEQPAAAQPAVAQQPTAEQPEAAQPPVAISMEQISQLPDPEEEDPEEESGVCKDHAQEIREFLSRDRSTRNRANQIQNTLDTAARNNTLPEKIDKICRLLVEFCDDFGEERGACLYSASIYEKIEKYECAIALYKYTEDLADAKRCADLAGDRELLKKVPAFEPYIEEEEEEQGRVYTGSIMKWSKEGIFGFLKCDERLPDGDNSIFFHLTSVQDNQLREWLYVTPKIDKDTDIHISVTFLLGVNGEQLAATRIERTKDDLLDIDQGQEMQQILKGELQEYKPFEAFGKVSANGQEYNFYKDAAKKDPYLTGYLENAFSYNPIKICFLPTKDRNGKPIVSEMVAALDAREAILKEYPQIKRDPEFDKKKLENLLIRKPRSNDLTGMPAYEELPLWQEDCDEDMELEYASWGQKNDVPYTGEDPLKDRSLAYPKEKNPYEQGVKVKDSNPQKAENYFLDELQKRDPNRKTQRELALASVITLIYNRQEQDPCEKGMPLLDYYAADIGLPVEKTSNLRISMLQKGKHYKELVDEIDAIFPRIYNAGKRRHYLHMKASSLAELGSYMEAIAALERYKKLLDAEGEQRECLNVDRMMAFNYYQAGETETAKEIAERILKINSDDEIAIAIQKDQLTEKNIPETEEFKFIPDEGSLRLEGYCKYKIDSIILDAQIAGVFRDYIKDNKLIGNPKKWGDAFKDYITQNIRKMPPEFKSNGWAFLAKVAIQILEQHDISEDVLDKISISKEVVKKYAGRAMLESGNYLALSMSNDLNTLQFFYVQALNLVPHKDEDAMNAFNRMVSSFYIARDQLAEMVRTPRNHESLYWENARGERCFSLRALFITTFLLDERTNPRVRELLEALLQNRLEVREDVISFGGLYPELCAASKNPSLDAYFQSWMQCKGEYSRWQKELIENLGKIESNISSEEGRDGHIRFLSKRLDEKKLLPLDEKYLKKLVDILEGIGRTLSRYEFDIQEEGLKSVINNCVVLETEIEKSPTSLSFDYVKECTNALKIYTTEKLDELYDKYKPELKIKEDCGYLRDSSITVSFLVENEYNRQTADIHSIEFSSQNPEIKIEQDINRPISVKGGETWSTYRKIEISPAYQEEYIEFTMTVSYGYKQAYEKKEEGVIRKEFHLELRNTDEFVEISNPYNRFADGTAVTGDLFRGRDKDIQGIVDMLQMENNDMLVHRGIIMYGQKRAGKSSILENLQEKIEEVYGKDTYLFFEIDSLGDVTDANKMNGILSKILTNMEFTLEREYLEIYKRLQQDGISFCVTDMECNPEHAGSIFERSFKKIAKAFEKYGGKNRYIPLFLIDEFTYIYEWIKREPDSSIRDFPHFWKAFLQNNRVCSIVVGQENTPIFFQMPRYANDFACMKQWPVTYLEEQGARDLIEGPIRKQDGNSRFDKQALRLLLDLTAGSAYLIVGLCDKLVKYMNEYCYETVTVWVLKEFLTKYIKEETNWDTRFEAQFSDPSKVGTGAEEKQMAEDNKALLREIACHCDRAGYIAKDEIAYTKLSDKTEAYRDRMLEALERRDVIEAKEGKVKIKIPLLKWVLRYQADMDIEEITYENR